MAMAITAPCFAQASPANAVKFFGIMNRYDRLPAQVSITGSLSQWSTDPLKIHFTDGYNDIWCTADNSGAVTWAPDAGGIRGTLTVHPGAMACVDQHHGNASIAGSGTMVFDYARTLATSVYWPQEMSLNAKSINVSFPTSPSCLYYSFAGVGTIDSPL